MVAHKIAAHAADFRGRLGARATTKWPALVSGFNWERQFNSAPDDTARAMHDEILSHADVSPRTTAPCAGRGFAPCA